jgi:two-component system, sensor histidine kinase
MSRGAAEARIEHDRIHALYAQGPLASFIALVIGGMIVAAMWGTVPRAALLTWYALVMANQAVRVFLVRAFRRENPTGARLREWARRYTISMAVGAAIFGSVALFMFPLAAPLGQVFLMICVAGMAAGSITANAYHPPAMVAYLLLMLLPTFLRLVLEGTAEYVLLAFTYLFFLAVLMTFGRSQAALIRRSIAVGHENVDLVEELKRKTALAEAAQAKAEQASLAKSQFFAAASHDLRQPLQALGLFAGSLREVNRDPENARRIDQILTSVDALESLFDELLDISKLDAGYVKPALAHFAAKTLFRRLENVSAPVARRSGLALAFDDAGAVLHSDPVLLERILGNLLSNALRYTTHGGVAVRCLQSGAPGNPSWAIEVTDTGRGIPAQEHERVFEEFYQLDNPERDRRKGLGLGLATVRRMAQLLRCKVGLVSEVGKGTTFTVIVPAGDAARIAPAPAAPSAAEVDALQGRRVAVIEDERGVREGLVELLRQWRCEVVAAGSARELIAALAAARVTPDVIVADYRLREHESGAAAIAAVRAACGVALPALMISGDTTPEIFTVAREQNIPLLSKPVRAARLRAALQTLLSGALGEEGGERSAGMAHP